MNDDSDFDSDFEDLVSSGMDIQIIFFDNIEQYLKPRKELDMIVGFDQNSKVAQYIIIKTINSSEVIFLLFLTFSL